MCPQTMASPVSCDELDREVLQLPAVGIGHVEVRNTPLHQAIEERVIGRVGVLEQCPEVIDRPFCRVRIPRLQNRLHEIATDLFPRWARPGKRRQRQQ